jgi:hypothetical protein
LRAIVQQQHGGVRHEQHGDRPSAPGAVREHREGPIRPPGDAGPANPPRNPPPADRPRGDAPFPPPGR